MTKPPPGDDTQNRIVAVTLDEESIGRSGPDIEHERAIAIYDLVEQNLFALDGHEARGRQHVVGAADIVADRLRRMRPQKDRAGIADPL